MKKFLEEFNGVIESSEKKLRTVSETQSAQKPSHNKWSSKEILGHLVDSSINNVPRFINGQLQEVLIFPGYDQNSWVNAQNYQNARWNFIIDLWKSNNQQISRVIETCPNNEMSRMRKKHNYDIITWKEVAKTEPTSLEYLIRDYFDHMKHHLNQILKMNSLKEV